MTKSTRDAVVDVARSLASELIGPMPEKAQPRSTLGKPYISKFEPRDPPRDAIKPQK